MGDVPTSTKLFLFHRGDTFRDSGTRRFSAAGRLGSVGHLAETLGRDSLSMAPMEEATLGERLADPAIDTIWLVNAEEARRRSQERFERLFDKL